MTTTSASSLALALALIVAPGAASAAKCPIPDDLPVPTQEMWSNFRARCDGANVRGCLKFEWSEQEYEQNGHKFRVRVQKNSCTHDVIMLADGCTNGNLSGYFIRALEQGGQMGISAFDPKTGEHSYSIRTWVCKPKAATGNNCSFADKSC